VSIGRNSNRKKNKLSKFKKKSTEDQGKIGKVEPCLLPPNWRLQTWRQRFRSELWPWWKHVKASSKGCLRPPASTTLKISKDHYWFPRKKQVSKISKFDPNVLIDSAASGGCWLGAFVQEPWRGTATTTQGKSSMVQYIRHGNWKYQLINDWKFIRLNGDVFPLFHCPVWLPEGWDSISRL
jgi:hypothetical protein